MRWRLRRRKEGFGKPRHHAKCLPDHHFADLGFFGKLGRQRENGYAESLYVGSFVLFA